MDVERSLVLGARDNWIGRLAMSATGSTSESYDFFLREMPKFGWQEITSVRSEVSVLTYTRGDRVATVQIRKKTLGGSAVDITVSPRGRPTAPTASSSMPASPAGTVETAPRALRLSIKGQWAKRRFSRHKYMNWAASAAPFFALFPAAGLKNIILSLK